MPYYIADLKRDPDLEKYPCIEGDGPGDVDSGPGGFRVQALEFWAGVSGF